MTAGDEAAILAKILANPADDTARLVLADWLDDRGRRIDRARAEFIRVQIELAGIPELRRINAGVGGVEWIRSLVRPATDPRAGDEHDHPALVEDRRLLDRHGDLSRRAAELLRGPKPDIYENGVIWFHSGNGTDTWRFLFRPAWRRGFVAEVTCAASDWREHGDAVRAAHPVETVRPTSRFGIEVKAAPDLSAPPGWACGYTLRKRWTWATLGRPDIDPDDDDALEKCVAEAEWPGVTFTLPGGGE